MIPFEYDIPDQLQGDTFGGVEFTLTDSETETAIDLTGYAVKMQVRDTSKAGRVLKEVDTDSGITITDAENGVLKVEPFTADLPIGNHHYDLEFSKDGNVNTWVKGKWNIVNDVTS